MTTGLFSKDDTMRLLAISPPLLVRLYGDGVDNALQRLVLLALIFAVAYGWGCVFSKKIGNRPKIDHLIFALLFVLFLPGQVGWGGAILSASFGWVLGSEIFGGRPIFSPVLIALAFAIFSFPGKGFEAQWILSSTPNLMLAIACLPGAVLLLLKGLLPWRVVIGALFGAIATVMLFASPESPPWWNHLLLGIFVPGILFLAAAHDCTPRNENARWIYGLMVGVLIITIRLTNPDQPDGVVFAVLLGALFAPLLDRTLSWRSGHE